jgi:hypothetical protein
MPLERNELHLKIKAMHDNVSSGAKSNVFLTLSLC